MIEFCPESHSRFENAVIMAKMEKWGWCGWDVGGFWFRVKGGLLGVGLSRCFGVDFLFEVFVGLEYVVWFLFESPLMICYVTGGEMILFGGRWWKFHGLLVFFFGNIFINFCLSNSVGFLLQKTTKFEEKRKWILQVSFFFQRYLGVEWNLPMTLCSNWKKSSYELSGIMKWAKIHQSLLSTILGIFVFCVCGEGEGSKCYWKK